MLERLQDAPDQVIGLSASGTVMARDIEDAIRLSAGPGGATPAGLVVVVDRDFDGYFAEIARALADAPRLTRLWSGSLWSRTPTGSTKRASAASAVRPSGSLRPPSEKRRSTGRRRGDRALRLEQAPVRRPPRRRRRFGACGRVSKG